jgi:hypothetical protein
LDLLLQPKIVVFTKTNIVSPKKKVFIGFILLNKDACIQNKF